MSAEAALGAQTLAFISRLVGQLRVLSTIRQALGCTCTAISELGGGRITEGPPAHAFTQLHDRHPLRLRYDGSFSERELCCFGGRSVGRHWYEIKVVLWGRLGRHGLVRWAGRLARTRAVRSFALALSQPKAMRLAEYSVPAHVLAQFRRDLTGAQALRP